MSVTSGSQSPNTLLSAAKSPSVNNIPKSTANGNTKTTYLRRERHKFGGIKRGESDKIEQLTEKNVDGYTHSIGINDLEHIERRYGIKGQADHTMADVNDIGRIRYVVENYDNIKRTVNDKGKPQFTNAYLDKEMKPAPLITYEKRVGGHVYVVEAVADTSKKEVRVLSVYMNTAKKEKAPYTANTDALASTSDNAYMDAFNSSISDSAKKSRRGQTGTKKIHLISTPNADVGPVPTAKGAKSSPIKNSMLDSTRQRSMELI